jgi:cell wall-associated NlpC family hydrolase
VAGARAATAAPPPAPVATPAAAAPAASSAGAVAEKTALAQLGRPYVYGGESPSGFDCSGLVRYAYQAAGVSLPRTSDAQMSAGTEVNEADLQAGDLVFFYAGTHVGIYVGNGEVVHAPVPGDVVKITKIAYMPYTTARHIG